MAPLTIVCVKWGSKYGPEWVYRLQRMVARNLPIEHEFVCVTERPIDGIACRPLLCDYPGWWQKIGLFRPGQFAGPILYLDLDVVITSSLLPIAQLLDEAPGLWVRDDFSYSIRKPREGLDPDFRRYLGGVGTINSSVMLWRDDVAREVWNRFNPGVMDEVHGDQNFISRTLYPDGLRFMPDEFVCSYKYDVLMRSRQPAPVVVFHGQPKASDLPRTDKLRGIWERAA